MRYCIENKKIVSVFPMTLGDIYRNHDLKLEFILNLTRFYFGDYYHDD